MKNFAQTMYLQIALELDICMSIISSLFCHCMTTFSDPDPKKHYPITLVTEIHCILHDIFPCLMLILNYRLTQP